MEFHSTNLQDNLQGYLNILSLPQANETDIIVFPEMTLAGNVYTYVPHESQRIAPCDYENSNEYEEHLIKLSCKAREIGKYVVINVPEKENCTVSEKDPRPCAANGLNIYNTNVVFDRQGMVISRYRKVHLYGEAKNVTYNAEYGIFDTDFGVRFGHFICFDILFYTPAQEMVEKHGITDFIMTSMWFSQLPFMTGMYVICNARIILNKREH